MNVTDLALVIIISFVTIIISGLFIFAQKEVGDELSDSFATLTAESDRGINYTQHYEDGFGATEDAFATLKWLTGFMLFGYALSIFFSAYMVNTRPIFFIVFFFITAISVIFAVAVSNAYSEIIANATISSAFSGMTAANYIMQYLPLWISGIGILGLIIMFARFKKNEESF